MIRIQPTVPYLALALALLFTAACGPQPEMDTNRRMPALYDYDVEERLTELGITLAPPAAPIANYVNAVQAGDLVFLAGKGPKRADGTYITGKVGEDLSIEEAYEAARLTAILQLAALKAEIGDLNRVARIVKVFGMVNSGPDFTQHPAVINGFSDVMVEVFGERGKHARAAVGMSSLPMGMACEIDMVVQIF